MLKEIQMQQWQELLLAPLFSAQPVDPSQVAEAEALSVVPQQVKVDSCGTEGFGASASPVPFSCHACDRV